MKIQTSKLEGAALNWAVAAALEWQFKEGRIAKIYRPDAAYPAWIERQNSPGSIPYYHRFYPSSDRAQGGAIIDAEGIGTALENGQWIAFYLVDNEDNPYDWDFRLSASGPTRLIAAMRCYVAAKLGNEVEIPDELTQNVAA